MTPARQLQPQRCDHYDACWFVHQHDRCSDDNPTEYEKDLPDCQFDTRTHTSAPAPAPAPDEKCEVCGNPLEYHNNAYRWCKNMHLFRYFQSPHTPAPAPVFDIDKEVEIIKQEKEHDTSIARQAREKFYKKATEAIEHQRDHKEFLLSKDTKDIILDIIDGVNAELRQQEPQQ